jgi:hypothetical protein
MNHDLQLTYSKLAEWCKRHDYAGYDPFDGLNSRLFQASPLKYSRLARLAWLQLFKRSPINFRKLTLVPPGRNSKGTALFALAKLSEFRRTGSALAATEARSLLGDLIENRIETKHGVAWGYNFDWQARAFFAPRGTPTVVPTAFAVRALCEATSSFDDDSYLAFARPACVFILEDLQRTSETASEICFSYTPVDSTFVFNASLLASEALASVGVLAKDPRLVDWAVKGARYVVCRQRPDGSWAYGSTSFHDWCDNFHTAFNLASLVRILKACPDCSDELTPALVRGYEFWRERFVLDDGWPKYYDDAKFPADIHSVSAAIVALVELNGLIPDALILAEKIADWAIRNMFDERGFFYYQIRRSLKIRIPYMRWSQAWMMYALALLAQGKKKKE